LLFVMTFSLVACFVLASCTSDPEADGRLIVNDEAKLLSAATRKELERIRFPVGTPVLVRTVATIPPSKIGSFATDAMEEESRWQELRQRGFLRTHFRQDPAWAPGIYVLVSREPSLLQIRYGSEVRLAAYEELIAAGAWYRARQRFQASALDPHLKRTLTELALKMDQVVHPRWPLSWARTATSWVAAEFEDYLAPSDGLLSTGVFANYIAVANRLGATGAPWRLIVFNLGVFVLFWLLGKKVLIESFLLPRVSRSGAKLALVIVTNLGLLCTLLLGAATLIFLSKGRVEDQMALDVLGLSSLSGMGLDGGFYGIHGGLWLALPGAAAGLVGEIIEIIEANSDTQQTTIALPYRFLGWGCALYLLPLAVGIGALVALVWSTGSMLIEARRYGRASGVDTGAGG
jgi:hypothetical protein